MAADSAGKSVAIAEKALKEAEEANSLSATQIEYTSVQVDAAKTDVILQLYEFCLEHNSVRIIDVPSGDD